jgi:hypothetical protein
MVIVANLSSRNIELSMQPREKRLQTAAFLFKRFAPGDQDLEGQGSDMHTMSLARQG